MLKPFGNGVRACIGQPFALLTVAMLLQTFRFSKANPSYQLLIKTSLTIKPQDFYIKAHLRDPEFLHHAGLVSGEHVPEEKKSSKSHTKVDAKTSN